MIIRQNFPVFVSRRYGREFRRGAARVTGLKYCCKFIKLSILLPTPCNVPFSVVVLTVILNLLILFFQSPIRRLFPRVT